MSGSQHTVKKCLKIGHVCDMKRKNDKNAKVWKPVTTKPNPSQQIQKLNHSQKGDINQSTQEKEYPRESSGMNTPSPAQQDEDWTTITTTSKVDIGRKGTTPTHNSSFVKYHNSITPLRIGDCPRGENNFDT
ncbi:unnamed protein product [Lathyrus sativus]|nr:unnamed protein product [Lathyrus sativus]